MNKRQKILIAGAALFAALFLFSGMMLEWQYMDGKQSADTFEAVADLVKPDETPRPGTDPGQTGSNAGGNTGEIDPALMAFEKYAAVYEQNRDFVGWISIDGTNINYPVMQTIDNDVFIRYKTVDGYKAYGKRGFLTKKEALDHEAEMRIKLTSPGFEPVKAADAKRTVQEYLEEWVEVHGKANLRPSTYIGYKCHIKNHIVPYIGQVPLAVQRFTGDTSLS